MEPALIHATDRPVNYTQIILYQLSLLLRSVNAALGRTIVALGSCCYDMTLLLTGRVGYQSHMNLFPKFILLLSKTAVTLSVFGLGFGIQSKRS